jgi:predicted DNA-binding WGR domain protein
MHYNFIGWNQEGNSDKVWVCIQLNGDQFGGSFATVWGRRGKKLQFKVFNQVSSWDMEPLTRSKYKKGYNKIDVDDLNKVYPEFEEDLQKGLGISGPDVHAASALDPSAFVAMIDRGKLLVYDTITNVSSKFSGDQNIVEVGFVKPMNFADVTSRISSLKNPSL